MVCRRTVLDERLARHAESQGVALVEGVNVTDPILDPSGRIRGVRTSDGTEYSAPVVVAADGNSSRLGLATVSYTHLTLPTILRV